MKFDIMVNLVILVIGALVALAPWTFAPVCVSPMRCWTTREVETILGALVAGLALVATYKALGRA